MSATGIIATDTLLLQTFVTRATFVMRIPFEAIAMIGTVAKVEGPIVELITSP